MFGTGWGFKGAAAKNQSSGLEVFSGGQRNGWFSLVAKF
jgi:hypothetical protein